MRRSLRPMSVESPGTAMDAGTGRPTAAAKRRLGVLAFLLAVGFAALPWLVTLVFAATSTGGSAYTSVAIIVYLVHVLGMLAALTLGVLAVVNRRGRGWGIAAIVISILFSQTVVSMILSLFGGLAPQV